MAYMSCQGELYLAKVENGIRQPLRFVGNVTALTVETDSETLEHKESHSGQRTTDFTMTKSKKVTVSATLEDFSRENLALAVSGNMVQTKSESVVAEALPTVKVGDVVKLNGFNVTSVTIKDSTSTSQKTLEKGTHYELDEKYGKLKFLSLDGVKQPFIVDYTTGQVDATTIMSADDDLFYLYFQGVNTADRDKPIILELWKVKKQAKGSVPFIHEELGQIELVGDCLSDTSKQSDEQLGLFGRVVVM